VRGENHDGFTGPVFDSVGFGDGVLGGGGEGGKDGEGGEQEARYDGRRNSRPSAASPSMAGDVFAG